MVWVSCPINQHTDAVFVCVTSEHGGNAPAWTRGLLAYGNMIDFNREQVLCCQVITEAAARCFACQHCAHWALLCMENCIEYACLHCTCGAALNAQNPIPQAHLCCTSGAASHMWVCTVCIENCALQPLSQGTLGGHPGWDTLQECGQLHVS